MPAQQQGESILKCSQLRRQRP